VSTSESSQGQERHRRHGEADKTQGDGGGATESTVQWLNLSQSDSWQYND
jgi:hypothetical protein